jgi:hypothetical protein
MEMEQVSLPKKRLSINNNVMGISDRIHREINKKYSSDYKLIDFLKPLLDQDMLDIVKTADQWCEKNENPITSSLRDTLYKKNIFFEKAINHFTGYARENVDNVTVNTIDFVADPRLNQPDNQLNLLPLPIKTYIMSRVYDEIESRYPIDITLSATVILCKICPAINMIATYSKDKILSLWDLTTGLHNAHFATGNLAINMIQFNSDGLKMGTVAHYVHLKDNRPKSCIIIWNTYTQQQLHCITEDNSVYHIDFAQDKNNNTLAVFSQDQKYSHHKKLTLWLLNKQQPEKNVEISPLPWAGETLIDIKLDNTYEGAVDSDNDKTVRITKKISPALHLCQKAVENHDYHSTIDQIKNSSSYIQLTDYEKKLIDKQIISKKAWLAITRSLSLVPRK